MVYEVIYLSTEIDLLDLRLHELNDVVDKFVIVEYPFNYSGAPCRMYYNENKERFKEFENKIIHVVDTNQYSGIKGINLSYLRKESKILMDAIGDCKDDDFIIVCDGDAVVKREAFERLDMRFHTTLRMEWCLYWMNAYCPDVGFDWAFGAPAKLFREKGSFIQVARFQNPEIKLLPDSGWHWSKLGGVDKIIENIRGYPHQNYAMDAQLLEPSLIQERIDNMWGWDDKSRGKNPGWKYLFRKFDPEYYPKYIGENLDIFSKYIKEI